MIFMDSKIIDNNKEYINYIINWISNKSKIITKLLYRKSDNGDSYQIFHNLCANKGTTLTLIKGNENFIIGGYTPLNWDDNSGWKNDNETFLFSLTDNKIFNKNKTEGSIYCSKFYGPHFHCLLFKDGNNMNKIYLANGCTNYKDLNNIIPNGGNKYHDVEEVEIYKIELI